MSEDTLTFADLVTRYLESQDADDLARLRQAVTSSSGFDPDLNLLEQVGPLVDAGRHQEVLDAVLATMPGAALSPLAHQMLSIAHAGLGDTSAARRELTMHRLSVTSVLSTGEGTREHPWSVLRVADEYDILRAKGVTPLAQSVHSVDGWITDRHEVEGGDDVWFVIDRPSRR